MSTVKHPEEKKILSLKRDRRNVYGENAKASRKSIPRGKRRSSKQARHAAVEVLLTQKGPSALLDLDGAEAEVKDRAVASKRKAFRKWADAPLAEVLISKSTGRWVWRVLAVPFPVTDQTLAAVHGLSKKKAGKPGR